MSSQMQTGLEDSSAQSEMNLSFGPKQRTLLEEITDILREYPDGSNILKELVQNADDAEASRVTFLLDSTQHSEDNLAIPGLSKYQGPALYSWNNAIFRAKDWDGIQKIGKSVKEKTALKVGRFGLGFVSVYHLTDCPTILSDKQFGINHPLMELTTQGQTGISWPLLSLSTNPQLYGHLSCYKGYFGFEGQADYPGTIFRFPFRKVKSEISENCYDVISVRNKLINPLMSEAEHALLFLKNVTSIEVCDRICGVDHALFKAEIPIAYLDNVKSYRREIVEFAFSEEFKSSTKIFVCLFPTVSRESGGEEKQTVWLVLNILGFGATKKKLQQFYNYHHLDYLPWVGVALATGVSNLTNCGRWQFKWNKENPSTVFDVISEVFKCPFIVDQDIELNISTGKIFCFLPTQLHSKFPFHFHGYFSLSSNRRAIPWPSDDNESEIGARWNLLLSEDLGSIAYAVFLFITIKALKHSSPLAYHYQLLSRWSPHEPDNSPFSSVLCGGLEILSKHNILLYTQQLGGRWLSICDGFFLPNLTKQYLTNEKVCLELLEKLNEPIIDVPESIQEVILNIPGIKSQISDRTINQNAIRELLKRFSGSNELREFLSSRDKAIPLLEGILTMCSGIESSKRIKRILEGIPLLPIASIDEPQIFAHKPIYISSNTSTLMNIFPGLESLFVDPYIPPKIHSNLLSIAIKCTPLNLIDVTKLVNDPQLFAELLFQSISGKFRFESNDSVDWMPSDPAHPPSTWIVKLFQFIDNSKSLLEAVSHLPILPQNSINDGIVSLLPLRSRTTYIEHSEDSHLIQLEKLLETSGCYLCYRQQFIVRFSEFVLPPIPKGLLIALKSKAVLNSFILALESTVDENLKFDLIELLIPITNAQNSKIISQLPLFPNTIGDWLKLSSIIILPPLKIPLDIAYPPHFISPFNSSVKQLYKKLNSKSLSNDAFIKYHLMPFIQTHKDPRIRNQLIVFVMDNLKLFDLDYLKSKEWILDSSANTEIEGRVKLYAPSQLFDPRDHILNRLLPPQTSGLFPHNILEDYFDVMRKSLGLKCYKNLSLKLCLQVCRYSLETIVSKSGNDWIDTFGALVEFLSVYRSTFDYESWKTLFKIFQSNFVISESIPGDWPENVDFSTSTQLCSPLQILICNSQDVYLVGSVQNTLILSQMMKDDVSEEIIREIGFLTDITTQMVVEHLAMLTKSRISKNDSELIHQIVSNIYLFLDRRVAEIQSIPLNMIYLPDEVAFVSQNRIVIEVPFDMKPFIYSLQDLKYRAVKFFDFLAIQKSPSSAQLSSILTEINSTCTALTSTQLELVINILNLIVNLNSQAEVYIPGKDMRMYSPKEEKLVFCDQIWLNRSMIEQDFIFVHEKISNDIARRLGVSHFNERITDPSEMWFEETGQKIAVTDRIRGILEGYHGTINVLKEMLQNADDAKATEMNVVFDWRIHPNMSLLSPQMEVWQGPAILFYNNSTFLDADFDNIMKIEAATKAHDVTSIGQFGLGFCTVYHLTDLPSFVSRNYIHILDPHGDYLKKGVKIDFCQERLVKYIQIYQDQFAPYQNIFGCDILKPSPFNGTLFRLPIRLSNITSKISLKTFNEQDINQIQDNFIKEAESVLFFMQHINSLGIYVINSDSRSEDMKSMHCVKRSANIPLNQPFLQANREHMIHMINGCNSTPVSSSCEYQLSITDKSDANWIVTYATGSEQCANLLNKLSHTRSLLPFAGVALNLDLFDQDRTAGSNSNLYCFLPLPIQIALPFHCHAMFELRQDRQGLVDTAEAKTKWNEAIVSDALVRAVFTLYKYLAIKMQSINTMEMHHTYTCLLLNMFSKDLTSNSLWKWFTQGITHEIINSQFNFFIVKSNKGTEWCSFQTTFFLNLPSIQSDLRGYYPQSFSDSLLHILIECGFQVAVIPEICFEKSGMLFYIFGESRSNVIDLRNFSIIFFENLGKFEIIRIIEVLNVLIPVCCSYQWFIDLIRSSKCIPCGEFGELQHTCDVVDPNATLVANLYDAKENRSPTKLCCETLFQIDSQTLHNLRTYCSIISVKLRVEELKSRANYISNNKNERLAHRFIEYLDQKIFTTSESDEMFSVLSTLTFIPVNIPTLTHNSILNQIHFKSPCQLIPCQFRELVEFQLPVFPEQFQQYYNFTSKTRISDFKFSGPLAPIAIDELKICIHNYNTLAVNIDLYAKVKKIYETLGENFDENSSKISQLPSNMVLIPFVGFCDTSILLVSSKEDFSPYIHSINIYYDINNRNTREFFNRIGVQKSLSVDQCQYTLRKLYTISQDTPLDSDEQIIVLRFTKEICDNITCTGEKNFILCQDNRVHYVEDCIFHDLSWDKREYSKGVFNYKNKTYYFIHKDVSNETAFRLGVNPLSSIKLSGRKPVLFHYSLHGQSEPLTTRLNNIIRDYECDVDVFKELTQNADDAKASEVKFLFDHSTHGITSILHEEMKHWQGPAVYCYNDATFSDADFENITKLASRTKMADQSTIGAFGIGFNTVYHLTDLPSFVSRRNIIFFEPHVLYLKQLIDHGSPGMQIDFVNENEEIQYYEDQFSVYNGIFGCDLFKKKEYNHTLFRLPLRSSKVSSKISSRRFDSTESIINLQTQLLEIAKDLIFFLQNIQCIEIYTRNDRDEDISLVCRVKKSLPNRFLSDNQSHFQELLSKNTQEAVTDVTSFTLTTIYPPSKETDPEEIIISYASGTTPSFELIPELKEDVEFSSLPVCAVAVVKSLITLSLKEFSKVKYSLFSFLPIPCTSPYPMHINGCFQLQPSRRALYSTADNTIRTRWNHALICDPLPIAVVNMLISLREEFVHNSLTITQIERYYSFWPNSNTGDVLWSDFSSYIADRIISINAQIFYCSLHPNRWITFKDVSFFLPPTKYSLDSWLINEIIFPYSARCGIFFMDMFPKFYEHKIFKKLIERKTNEFTVARFYKEIIVGVFEKFEIDIIKSIAIIDVIYRIISVLLLTFKYEPCLKDLLTSLKCIPCGEEAPVFLPIPQVLSPNSRFRQIFYPRDKRLPHSSFNALFDEKESPETFHTLNLLGVITDRLPLGLLVDRCGITLELSQYNEELGLTHSECLLDYLNTLRIDQPQREEIQHLLFDIRFIPVCQDSIFNFICPEIACKFSSPAKCRGNDLQHLSVDYHIITKEVNSQCHALTLLGISDKDIPLESVMETLFILEVNESLLSNKLVEVTKRCRAIYNYLAKKCYILDEYLENNRLIIQQNLEGRKWLWVRSLKKFYPISKVISSTDYLSYQSSFLVSFILPEMIDQESVIKKFFTFMKLPTKVTSNMAINIISLIKEHFGNQSLPSPTLSGNGPNERELVIKLINEAIEVKDDEKFEGIFLLTENNNLKLSSSLYINDVPWVEFTEEERESLVNHRITTKVSHKLGAKSKMDTLYEQEWEDFGQHEDMSKRIDNLLREFPLDVTIFKELIQNADDAKATKIVFILDTQEYGDTSLCPSGYKPKWKELQKTPSLLVYNNQSFSPDDLIGIQAVGIGGKENKTTIGRFGLGFNSVFHLTRCPCLLTCSDDGEEYVFCVFDPYKEHLNIPKGKRPGTKVTFNKQRPLSCFTHQFEPYFVNPILNKYPSVMKNLWKRKSFSIFRFPLNTTINKNLDTKENVRIMRKLLEQLKNEAPRLLPFISNVKQIQIFEVSCIPSCKPIVLRNVEIFSQLLTSRRVEVEKPIAGYSRTMRILRNRITVEVPTNMRTGTMKVLNKIEWLIYHFEGNLNMFCGRSELLKKHKSKYELEKLRLFSSVAVELISKDRHFPPQKRYLYCHLPFGASLNFPVHINAPFILDPYRKYVSYQDEISGSKSWDYVWHCEIMNLVLAPLYFKLLYDLGPGGVNRCCDLSDVEYFDWYYSLFPIIEHTEPGSNSMEYLQALGKSVLTMLYKSNSEVLLADDIDRNINCTWYPVHGPNAGVFKKVEPDITKRKSMVTLNKCLIELKYHLTLAPYTLAKSFKACSEDGSKCKYVTPLDVLQYINLHTSNLCKDNLEYPCSLENCIFNFYNLLIILKFILTHFDIDPKAEEQIPSIPLKVDSANTIGWFSLTQPTFTIQYALLLPHHPDRFISKEYNAHIIKLLTHHGYVENLSIQFLKHNMYISHQPSPEFFLLFWHFIYENVHDPEKLAQFSHFKLAPVTYGKDQLADPEFQPIAHLFHLATDEMEPLLTKILCKFECPFLHLTPYLKYKKHPPEGIENVSPILNLLISKAIRTIDGNSIIKCISSAKNIEVVLADEEAERLRNLFPNITFKYLSGGDWQTLSRIKMFVAECKPDEYNLIALKECRVCYLNDDKFPISENLILKLRDLYNISFLSSHINHHNPLNLIMSICSQVGIHCLALNEFIETYILNINVLPCLEFKDQKAIIFFIFKHSALNKDWISILKSLPFIYIPGYEQCLYKPSELYCSNVHLFAAFKVDKLLPQCWAKVNDLYTKIVTLGLKTKINLEDILHCAKVVAMNDPHHFEYNDIQLPIQALIDFVDSHIYSDQSEEVDLLLQQFSTLNFLPLHVRETFVGTVVNPGLQWRLGCFSQALVSKHHDYCCMSFPIFDPVLSFKDPVSDASKTTFNRVMKLLGLKLNPSIHLVKQHLQKLMELCNIYTLEEVDQHLRKLFIATYKYLQDCPNALPEFENKNCILFESKLYQPMNLVMNWSNDLSPYLFQCPHELRQVTNFLLKLKVSENPNYEHFKFVLMSIHRENGSDQLNQNNILCAKSESAFSFLISELHSLPTDTQIARGGILLLSDKNQFISYDSPHLFYGDDTQLLNRVHTVDEELRILAPLSPNKLGSFAPPHILGIKFLSDRFKQILSQWVYEKYNTEDNLADILKNRLKSVEVFAGLKRIYYHDTLKILSKVRIKNRKIYHQTEEDQYRLADGYLSITDKINKLEIVPVSRIDIEILDTSTRIRRPLRNACMCFLDEDKDTILINTDELKRERLPVEMTYELNQYLANLFDKSLIHLLICHVYQGAEIELALNNFGIRRLPHDLAQN